MRTVVALAVAPEETVSVPRTLALVARPPEETKRFAPALTVSPIAEVAEVPPAAAQVKTWLVAETAFSVSVPASTPLETTKAPPEKTVAEVPTPSETPISEPPELIRAAAADRFAGRRFR